MVLRFTLIKALWLKLYLALTRPMSTQDKYLNNFVWPSFQLLHAMIQIHWPFDSIEKDFLKSFYFVSSWKYFGIIDNAFIVILEYN